MESTQVLKSDPRSRPKPFTFRPPKPNRFVIWATKRFIRRLIRKKLKVVEVEIPDDDLARLRALQGQRCLLTPSHSGGFEPHIVLYLSKLLGDHYYYVAAMEAFEVSPIIGWLMQRLGAYSIIRGVPDRPSLQTSLRILKEGKRWLVIFPEGQTVWQNSMVIPFQEGVFQLAFKGYDKAAQKDPAASLFCVPIAIKYVYLEDMHPAIDASMDRLESRLFDTAPANRIPRHKRLRRIGEAVLAANEKTYHLTPDESTTTDARIQAVKERIVSHLEQQLDVVPPTDQALLDRIRTLFNTVDRIVSDEHDQPEYVRKLAEQHRRTAETLYDDLWRILQFVAIYDGYVREHMTMERFLDVLCLLEMEVFGERRIWGPRKALVKVGVPIDLRDHRDAYNEDRHIATRDVTLAAESSVRTMLNTLAQGRRTVEPDR